jgi:hypothetical protein
METCKLQTTTTKNTLPTMIIQANNDILVPKTTPASVHQKLLQIADLKTFDTMVTYKISRESIKK